MKSQILLIATFAMTLCNYSNRHFRVTKEMKEEVKAKNDSPEFCRQSIREKLDRDK